MVTKLGPERCAMRSPAGWETFVQGSGNIDTKLLQGWVIVDTPRNHLTRKLPPPKGSGHEPKADTAEPNFVTENDPENAEEETRANAGLDPVNLETGSGGKTRGKRPRIKRP